jgi:hypothetical protein
MAPYIRRDVPTKLKLAEARLRARMGTATLVLARLKAIKAAKHALRAQGHKPDRMHRWQIDEVGEAYLAAHKAELIAEAKVIIERWRVEGFFGERHNLTITHKTQRPERQGFLLCKYQAQNGERK